MVEYLGMEGLTKIEVPKTPYQQPKTAPKYGARTPTTTRATVSPTI